VAKIKVIARKDCMATFTITDGTRKEVENSIADKLRSDTEIVWVDDPEGIRAACIRDQDNDVWRPRRRFTLNKDESIARPNGEE
jgi:hypothetical protein